MPSQRQLERDLWRLVASIRSPKEAELLLTDLLTHAEIRSLSKRWYELQLLAMSVPQREVAKKCGISISKVTRGSKVLSLGTGGAWTLLKRLKKAKSSAKSHFSKLDNWTRKM
jgi:Trp operon repressor